MTTPDPALVQAARAWIKAYMPPQPLEYTDEYIVKMVAAFGAAQRADMAAALDLALRWLVKLGESQRDRVWLAAGSFPALADAEDQIRAALRAARPEGTR